MNNHDKAVAREARYMTRKEVILKAINKKINWIQAADILGVTPRHMRRLKKRWESHGYNGLKGYRGGKPRCRRIPLKVIEELCRLKKETYPDFSVRHFYEYATEKHKLGLSYNWTRIVLEEAGIVEKAPARGKHRRKRERRPMTGMLIHIDGSTHTWVQGLPQWDLILVLDDADGRALYGRFVPQEGTMSTLAALEHVFIRYGRFCEFYHDRGSHFGRTSQAGAEPDEEQNGQVTRVLKTLGIRQIFARSPEARGRSERAFGTCQGRLPQELRLEGIRSYEEANVYLNQTFLPKKFNRQFTVRPAQAETAFVPLAGVNLKLLLSIQHERVVRNDNTVTYENVILQIPERPERIHFVRCPVIVHEFPDETLGISYQGRLLGAYHRDGTILEKSKHKAA